MSHAVEQSFVLYDAARAAFEAGDLVRALGLLEQSLAGDIHFKTLELSARFGAASVGIVRRSSHWRRPQD